jgi:hypothetical protein
LSIKHIIMNINEVSSDAIVTGIPDRLVSRLLSCILTLSLIIIKQERWALKTKPGERAVTEVAEALSAIGDSEEDCTDYDMDRPQSDLHEDLKSQSESTVENTSLNRTIPSTQQKELDYWNLTRFLLNQERERLCVWSFDFIEPEHGSLTTKANWDLFVGFTSSLIRIGEALSNEAGMSLVFIPFIMH